MIRNNLGEMHICVGDECADFTAKAGDPCTAWRSHRRLLAISQKLAPRLKMWHQIWHHLKTPLKKAKVVHQRRHRRRHGI